MTFAEDFLKETQQIAKAISVYDVEKAAKVLRETRDRYGRLFVLGVGGSAANASHAVNDFRKICDIEAYAPTDNVAELTARTNDEGWATVFESWLKGSPPICSAVVPRGTEAAAPPKLNWLPPIKTSPDGPILT